MSKTLRGMDKMPQKSRFLTDNLLLKSHNHSNMTSYFNKPWDWYMYVYRYTLINVYPKYMSVHYFGINIFQLNIYLEDNETGKYFFPNTRKGTCFLH